ncbi:SRPBCC family protein [Planctomicrobium sp. SH664]|uniref:SRPBCC family protein n=1 Tax=Planctomicrobium sp. SH664 TaxID=3448125 RepID=UPI003F5B0B3A
MPTIEHEIKLSATPDQISRALTAPEGLRSWKNRTAIGNGQLGSVWIFRYENGIEFQWKIAVSNPHQVVWECISGPGDSAGTIAEFTLHPLPDGRTLLTCSHQGWPTTAGNYRRCNTAWAILLHHLKTYVETGRSSPAFP